MRDSFAHLYSKNNIPLSNLHKVYFYIGWFGNLSTCILAGYCLLYTLWAEINWFCNPPLKFETGSTIAILIIIIYSSLVTRGTFKWLKQPSRQSAFDFIVYWVLSPIILFLVFMAAMVDFPGGGFGN